MTSFKSIFRVALLMICASLAVAHADVKYTMVTQNTSAESPSQPSDFGEETNIYFVAANKTRKEYKQANTPYNSKETFITRCDLHQIFRIDDSLKIYTVSAMNKDGVSKHPAVNSHAHKNVPEEKVVDHFSIQELAPEKMNGFDTKCYLITIHIQNSGYMGNSSNDLKTKVWVTDMPGWQPCDFNKSRTAYSTRIEKTPDGDRRMTYENTGDLDAWNKISAEFPVRSETTFYTPQWSDNVKAYVNVTAFSQTKLDNRLFEVPAGYRKVSSEEYEKLQDQAKNKAVQESKHSKPQQ